MNEASGGKQEPINTTSTWDVISNQTISSVAGTMHHHHHHHQQHHLHHQSSIMQQESGSAMSQVIVPTPVKLQAQIMPPAPNIVDHLTPMVHLSQPVPISQVINK